MFGIKNEDECVDNFKLVLDVVKNVKNKVNAVEAAIFLNDIYTSIYPLIPPDKNTHPYKSILAVESENVIEYSGYQDAMVNYIEFGIWEYFKLTYDEWMGKTINEQSMMSKISINHVRKRLDTVSDLNSQLNL